MENKRYLFSKLPKVDEVLNRDEIVNILDEVPREIVLETIREEIDSLRKKILDDIINKEVLNDKILEFDSNIIKSSYKKIDNKLKRVINATGTVIHTNLGRSLIDKKIMEHVSLIASNYSNLEYDVEVGKRGSRYSHIEDIITRITGAEAALVVNNNAAAVMLVLSSLAKEKEVIISRGELVEIGGSFRVPAVMEQSGAKLVDIGTTNKTHLFDYENVISEETAILLKVHTSNYRIVGFTSSVSLDDLVMLSNKNNIPLVEDIGSGVLIDLSKYGLEYEPTVQDSIKAGVDIVTFSGDKLLGGPQAGIIVGKKKYIDIFKKNPLTRAIRVDKFTIAALEVVLRMYLNEEEAIKNIPTLRMLTMPIEEIENKARLLYNSLVNELGDEFSIKIVDEYSQVGGGSMPLEKINTKAIKLKSESMDISTLERKLRNFTIPVIARIYKDEMYLDLRTIDKSEISIVVDAFNYAKGV